MEHLARGRIEGADTHGDLHQRGMGAATELIHALIGGVQQGLLQFGNVTGLGFDPDADGHAQGREFWIEHRHAQQAALNQRTNFAARLTSLTIQPIQVVLEVRRAAVDGLGGLALQVAQVFAL
ncbi:hypothetical protein D3C77_649060 [compost metagenome]